MSRNPRTARGRRALTAVLAGIGLLATPFVALPATAAPAGGGSDARVDQLRPERPDYQDGRYFVILKDDPVATYSGDKKGYPATAATDGALDTDSTVVRKYDQHLTQRQEQVASAASVSVDQHFTTALNAFVSELTADQARSLSQDDRVLAVSEVEQFAPDYSSTEFLGLPGSRGTWNNTYGGVENAGKGVVVGVIDTGYYPEQEMLAGDEVEPLSGEPEVGEPYLDSTGRIAMLKADGTTFRGECEAGEDFSGDECNSKVLSARYFSEDFEAFVPADQRDPRERLSPIDIESHGTHTATTAAGNDGVEQVMNGGASYGEGSGVAPEAKVAVYKTCWEDTNPDTGGCFSTASVAAIEQAIVDGVDVLNYSISGSNNSIVDPVSLAFKAAAEAGIFVAASAGNSGPTAQTANHSAPWVTSVAATTFSNELTGTVEFEGGRKFRGVSSMTEGVGPAEVVLSSEVGLAGKTADEVRLCAPGALDPAQAEGRIVVCDRGTYDRVAKSLAVEQAGGIGMVLVNIGGGSEDADRHSVPTVHISDESIKDLVAGTDEEATLVVGDTTDLDPVPVPQIAGFSSRGPSTAVNSELLTPDVAAPGVNVLAGVSPLDPTYQGDSFGLMSGTSMAAPNLAGMAALMSAKYPDWSPMAVKSAMMTSAGDVLTAEGSPNTDNFATGAGSADPEAMAAPGLVYESDTRQWDALVRGDIGGRDVNLASIAVNDLLGSATVTRTVTATESGSWQAGGSVPGYEVSAEPSTLELEAGESAEVEITLTRTEATGNEWTHGSFSWSRAGQEDVTSPVTVRAVDVTAPDAVTGAGAQGTEDVELRSGIDGDLDPQVEGLGKSEIEEFTKVPGPLNDPTGASVHGSATEVPEGATTVAWRLEADDDIADWDLYLVTPAGQQITVATASGSEQYVLTDPAPGRYLAVAHLYASDGGAAASASLETVVMAGDAGNLSIEPEPLTVETGEAATATLAWSGLGTGTWRGLVEWAPGTRTAVTVTVGEDDGGNGEGGTGPDSCDRQDFADNQPGSAFYAPVRWMSCTGISVGYSSDNTYRKSQDVTRGETTAFLYRYVDPEFTAPGTSPFTDVNAGGAFFTPIMWASAEDVAAGYADGTFKPSRAVTRGEFAAFLYRLEQPDFTAPSTSPFQDLNVDGANYEAITWLASEAIAVGDTRGNFRQSAEITRGEISAFLQRYDAAVDEG